MWSILSNTRRVKYVLWIFCIICSMHKKRRPGFLDLGHLLKTDFNFKCLSCNSTELVVVYIWLDSLVIINKRARVRNLNNFHHISLNLIFPTISATLSRKMAISFPEIHFAGLKVYFLNHTLHLAQNWLTRLKRWLYLRN